MGWVKSSVSRTTGCARIFSGSRRSASMYAVRPSGDEVSSARA